MIKEEDRREILLRRKLMRRHLTLYHDACDKYHVALKYAHSRGATPSEIAELLDISAGRVKQIIYEKED